MLGMILTLIKPINAFLIGLFLWSSHKYWAAAWIMVLMFCDIYDGILFRKSTWATSPPEWIKTKFGINDLSWFRRVCDIVGDRLAVEFCLILTIFWYEFPIELYLVELVRDLFLLAVWVHGKYQRKATIANPNLLSRISMFAFGMIGVFWLIDLPTLAYHTIWIVIACGLLGIAQYLMSVMLCHKNGWSFRADCGEIALGMSLMLATAVAYIALLRTIFTDLATGLYVGMGILVVLMIINLGVLWYFSAERFPEMAQRFREQSEAREKDKVRRAILI